MAKKKKAKSHRKSAKRVRAGKKAAATRRRKATTRRRSERKYGKGKRSPRATKTRRSRAAKKAARTRRDKKEARRRAGKKAARCRKAKRTGNVASHKRNCKKPRRKSRKSSKVHGKANMSISEAKPRRRRRRRHAAAAMAPRRRRRRHHHAMAKRHSRRHARRHHMNPISGGGEFIAGFFGAVLGGLGAIMGDRAVATHALGGTTGAYTDAPTTGQIYNSEAPSAPMWSSWKRLVVAAAAMGVPLGISMAVKGAKAKSFFQLAFFGALTTTGVKLATDGVAQLTGTTSFGARFFAPELKADNDMAGAATTAQATYSLTGNSTTGFLSGPRRGMGASLIPPGTVPITNPNPGNSDFGPNPQPPTFTRPPNSFGPPGQGYNPNPVSPPQGSSQGTNLPPSGGGSQGGTVTPGTPVTPPSYMQPYPPPPGGNSGSLPIPQPMSNGSCGGGCGCDDFNPMTAGLSPEELAS